MDVDVVVLKLATNDVHTNKVFEHGITNLFHCMNALQDDGLLRLSLTSKMRSNPMCYG